VVDQWYALILTLQFVAESRKAQKYLLGVFEMLVGEVYPELMAKVPHILKAFYDSDIVEEESLLEWADKVRVGSDRGSCSSLARGSGGVTGYYISIQLLLLCLPLVT